MIETVPPGTILQGRYRIERVLGSGGFGHVYLAQDLVTNQQYAVKEYLVTGTNGQEQLQHEANVLSQLHHPNLPAFYDAFSERGRYYMVLNYIEGNDLTDIIRLARQRNEIVPLVRIMDWLLSICDAVMFLHSQHPPIIHRDIKPDNIRIMPDGTAILVDLGNAKAAADGARTLFFIRHQGTPGYAPPEQYPGGSGTDARSDVYALGGTLYFALITQEPPSVSNRNQSIQQRQVDLPSLQDQLAKNPPEDSPEANAARQFRLGVTKPGKPAPRHSRHLAQLGTLPPELLARLNLIIQRSMNMKQKERYLSVAEFSRDLKMVADVLATQAQPRQIDLHSTQPDLAMAYEALQAQQEQAQAQQASASPVASPQSTGPAPSASQTICPRCGEPLVSRATFCPHCGTPLTSNSQPHQSISTQPNSIVPSSVQPIALQDVDKTMVVTPPRAQQNMPKKASFLASSQSFTEKPSMAPMTGVASTANPPVTTPTAMTGQRVTSQNMPLRSREVHTSLQNSASQHSSSSSTGLKIGPRMIFVALLILVMLLVLMAILLVHTRTGMHTPPFQPFPVTARDIFFTYVS